MFAKDYCAENTSRVVSNDSRANLLATVVWVAVLVNLINCARSLDIKVCAAILVCVITDVLNRVVHAVDEHVV